MDKITMLHHQLAFRFHPLALKDLALRQQAYLVLYPSWYLHRQLKKVLVMQQVKMKIS
ncbi:MAG: hypothetical protein ACI8PW_001139 [Methylophilaceae bacterium]|jgi:hypothetical protein